MKKCWLEDDLSENQVITLLTLYGNLSEEDAELRVQQWSCQKDTGTKYDEIRKEFIAGDISATEYKGLLKKYGGYDEKAANSALTSATSDQFKEGKLTKAQAIKQLTTYAGKNRDEAEDKLIFWQFQMDHPDSELTENSVLQYEELKSTGISLEVFTKYKELCEGKSKRAEILPIINSLPLTVRQKDALYFAKGYAESTLHEAPWH